MKCMAGHIDKSSFRKTFLGLFCSNNQIFSCAHLKKCIVLFEYCEY
uniref:Uncharacterized protein n=1 Tax=Anguilla anguilla TaxID=7936 RepID=A0A0E9XKD7_ANGAN